MHFSNFVRSAIFLFITIRSFCSSLKSMPKLYFRHGAVSSAKTLNLLAVAHNYKTQGKSVVLMKPALDVRFGEGAVTSRAGLSQVADFLLGPDTDILTLPVAGTKMHCILVDEAQFLNPAQIDQLRLVTTLWNVPVICYGLRTDFRTHLFPGSQRLLEVADTIEEVKTTCHFCNAKAILNLKHVDGVADTTGPAVQLGAEEKYFPTCFNCYRNNLNDAEGQIPVGIWSRKLEKMLKEEGAAIHADADPAAYQEREPTTVFGEKKDYSP